MWGPDSFEFQLENYWGVGMYVRETLVELLYLYEPTVFCKMGLFISSSQGFSEDNNSCESTLETGKHCTHKRGLGY